MWDYGVFDVVLWLVLWFVGFDCDGGVDGCDDFGFGCVVVCCVRYLLVVVVVWCFVLECDGFFCVVVYVVCVFCVELCGVVDEFVVGCFVDG